MKIRLFLCLLLIFVLGCSKDDTSSPLVPKKQDLTVPEPVKEQGKQLEPVIYASEDQQKVEKAPQGMAFIKGGCFMMGSDHAQADEQPRHTVCVDDFYMDKHEVTQSRWKKVMGGNPSKFIGDDLPVEQINFFEVQEFIKKIN